MDGFVITAIEVYAGIAVVGMLFIAIGARRVNRQLPGFHPKYYPDGYIIPHRRVRKILHLKNEMMPKWMYVYMLSFFVHIPLFIASTVLTLAVRNELFVSVVGVCNLAVILGFRVYFIVWNMIYMNPTPKERMQTFCKKIREKKFSQKS